MLALADVVRRSDKDPFRRHQLNRGFACPTTLSVVGAKKGTKTVTHMFLLRARPTVLDHNVTVPCKHEPTASVMKNIPFAVKKERRKRMLSWQIGCFLGDVGSISQESPIHLWVVFFCGGVGGHSEKRQVYVAPVIRGSAISLQKKELEPL